MEGADEDTTRNTTAMSGTLFDVDIISTTLSSRRKKRQTSETESTCLFLLVAD